MRDPDLARPQRPSALGVPPRRIVFDTSPERGSRRMTVPSRLFATHRAVGVARTAAGPSPTGVVPATAFVPVSTRTSVLSPAFAIHAPAAFTATAAGPWPTGIVVATSVVGSMRVTVPSERFVTQTEPAPAAIAEGAFPTPTDPTTRPESASIRETTPSGSTIQIEPNAASVGRTVPPKNEPAAASGRVDAETVVPRVDLRDLAGLVRHPDGARRAGKRCRRAADRNGSHGLSRRDVDAGHALVVEVRDPQRAGARQRAPPVELRPERSPRSNRMDPGRRPSSAPRRDHPSHA